VHRARFRDLNSKKNGSKQKMMQNRNVVVYVYTIYFYFAGSCKPCTFSLDVSAAQDHDHNCVGWNSFCPAETNAGG
jgi:hypothetical protein